MTTVVDIHWSIKKKTMRSFIVAFSKIEVDLKMGFPGGSDGKEIACQCKRRGF